MSFSRAPLLQTGPGPFAGAESGWVDLLPWLVLVGLVGLALVVVILLRIARTLEEYSEQVRGMAAVQSELREAASRLVAERSDIDLRRIEHVLLDQREALTRLEDALLSTVQQAFAQRANDSAAAPPARERGPGDRADDLGERIVNRLIAMGYERVQIVTARDELEALGEERAEVGLEAKKLGVLYKGRAIVQGGRIADVDMKPPYAMFP